MTTKTEKEHNPNEYLGIVRFKDGSKQKYDIAKSIGGVQEAVEGLLNEAPNAKVGLILVPKHIQSGNDEYEPQVA